MAGCLKRTLLGLRSANQGEECSFSRLPLPAPASFSGRPSTSTSSNIQLGCPAGPNWRCGSLGQATSVQRVMQGSLAVLGCSIGLVAAWVLRDGLTAVAALLLGLVVPFTLSVIFPTNKQLLNPTLSPNSALAGTLLARWNRLRAVRSLLSGLAFALLASGL